MTYPRIASGSWLHISCGSGFTLRNTNRLQWSLRGQVYARTWALADRRTAVVVAVRDWLPAEGAYVCFSARPDPPQRRSFFQTPAYLLQKEPRSARGLPAMSSLLGVVRKQLKSHPAVSDRPARFRPMRSGDIESAAEDARPTDLIKNHLMCHHLIQSF